MIIFKKILMLIVMYSCAACGLGGYHSLGDAYYYLETSSIDGRIVKIVSKKPLVLYGAAVVEYSYDSRYIIAARVPAAYFMCRINTKELKEAEGVDVYFENRLEYSVIEKSSENKLIFNDIDALYKYLKEINFTKKLSSVESMSKKKVPLSSNVRFETCQLQSM
jgi:hypothetical protein